MIEKDEFPIEAVTPTISQKSFLERIVQATSEYAKSKDLNDMYFQGHSDQKYFGAYSSKIIRRGAGIFIFGFARRSGILHFAFPIDIPEPYKLAKSWIGDPTRNRATIDLDENTSEEIQLYILDLAKKSIDYVYNKISKNAQ